MRGIPASYRWRRRLVWLTATAFVIAVPIAIGLATGLKWNTVAKAHGPSNVPARIDTSPKPVRLKHDDEKLMLAVASRFIDTAVARKHVDRSWDLASSDLRAGFTRKQWDSGDMPVVPYPVGETKFRLDFADTEGVGFSIVLFPAKGSSEPPRDFLLGLHPSGSGKHRHWVVDYWQSAPTGAAVGSVSRAGAQSPPEGTAKESKAWLLLPAALLSLIVLIPLGVVSTNWYRARRAARAFVRS